jgi:hypothetical protein
MRHFIGALVAVHLLVACSDSAGPRPSPVRTLGTDAGGGATEVDTAYELRVPVPESGRVFVNLRDAHVVAPPDDPHGSVAWDIAFEGLDVFTNGGVSGGGRAGAFGPLDASMLLLDEAPSVPFMSADRSGGAFVDWYAYEGAPAHALWSRYHVVAVKDGTRLWKVQVLTYYGDRDGAPVSGLYKVRYAELFDAGPGPTRELVSLDGTAGGPKAIAESPSECLDLASGERMMLTPEAARRSHAWHLCFRRQAVVVNGEAGGPRGVGAVDLDAPLAATETVDAVKARTAESARPAFDAVTRTACDGKSFRGDRIVSAFGDAWIDRSRSPIAPAPGAWLVADASGTQTYLVAFAALEGATKSSPGTVVMRIKPVGEP